MNSKNCSNFVYSKKILCVRKGKRRIWNLRIFSMRIFSLINLTNKQDIWTEEMGRETRS